MYKLCLLLFIVHAMVAPFEQASVPGGVRSRRQAVQGDNRPTVGPGIVLADCIRTCPSTSEYNPVCGNNSITYDNPGRLLCAQACGVSVRQLRESRC